MKSTYEKFIEKVVKTAGCWEWIGYKEKFGHGRISVKKEGRWIMIGAHRASWELFKGQIPVGKFVCHTCDNPSCVNPDHLWIGSRSDNSIDMWNKGRGKLSTYRNMELYKFNPHWKCKSKMGG